MASETATKWWTLGVVSVATFMLLLDITVVNVALPSIEDDLDATFTDLQWVVDAYTLTLAAVVLTAGSLADRLGRRLVFAVGLGIFSVASLVAGLATDPTFLNIARGVQGIGGAAMFAVSLALIAQEFPAGRERGTAMAVYGATIGLAVAFGPLVGGAIVESLGWEWIFFINVPIGVAAIAISYARVRESRDPNATGIDWPGLLTFSSSLFLLVLALIRGNAEGWGSPADRRPVRRRGGPAGRVHRDRAPSGGADAAAGPVQAARLHRRPDCRIRSLGLDVRAVPVPDALRPELPGARGARDRPALPAADGGELPRRGGRRHRHRPRSGARDHGGRPGRHRRGPAPDLGRRESRTSGPGCSAASSSPGRASAC